MPAASGHTVGVILGHNGGLSLITTDDYSVTSSKTLGNQIAGSPVSDIWDLNYAADGTAVFGMLIPGTSGLAAGTAFALGSAGQTQLMSSPDQQTTIGIIRLGLQIFWYQGVGHTSKTQ